MYLCAGKPPLADIILSHPPDLTRCDSVIGLAIPAMSGHIQYRGTASGDLYIGISGTNRVFLSYSFRNFSAIRSDGQCIGDCQSARDFAVTEWLTVIYRYFGGNPDEGSDFISKGFVASAIFILYTRKFNPIFSDFQNRIFHFDIAALDMTNLEWSNIFPQSRTSLLLVLTFVLLGDVGKTKLIRETTLKGHISGSLRGITISRTGLKLPWSQLNLKSIKPLWCVQMPGVAKDNGQEGIK